MGAIGAMMWLYSDQAQHKRERKAFNKLDTSDMTPRKIWDKALKFGRNERLNMRGELEQANKILDKAEDICRVADGLRKCTVMAADDSVPAVVKEWVLQHWLNQFGALFGLDQAAFDCIFSDEKMLARIGQLQKADEEYRSSFTALKRLNERQGVKDTKAIDPAGKVLSCSFCGKFKNEVKTIVAGPSVYICDECVDLCQDIVKESNERRVEV